MGTLHFYVGQKWSTSMGLETFEEWREANPDAYKELLAINRIYRDYKAENPENEWIDSTQGELPKLIVQKLEAISYVRSNFVNNEDYAAEMEEVEKLADAYPGLQMEDIRAHTHSLENIIFNTEFDLASPDERIFPEIKWVQGNFTFSVNLTPEQFEARKEKDFLGLWCDTQLVVGEMWYEQREMFAGDFGYQDGLYE